MSTNAVTKLHASRVGPKPDHPHLGDWLIFSQTQMTHVPHTYLVPPGEQPPHCIQAPHHRLPRVGGLLQSESLFGLAPGMGDSRQALRVEAPVAPVRGWPPSCGLRKLRVFPHRRNGWKGLAMDWPWKAKRLLFPMGFPLSPLLARFLSLGPIVLRSEACQLLTSQRVPSSIQTEPD